MIRVTIELYPGGDASRAETIGQIDIANVSGLARTSSYDCKVDATGCPAMNIPPVKARFAVHGHRRDEGVLKLLYRVLWRVRNGWTS